MQIIKKIYRPDFLKINKNDFRGLFIFIHVAMATAYIRQFNYLKTEVCFVNLFATIFGDQKDQGF